MQGIEMQVRFEICGFDCEPEQVSALLGVKPNHTWRRGDSVGLRGEVHKSSMWSITATPSEANDVEVDVLALLNRLPATLAPLRGVTARWEAQVSVVMPVDDMSLGLFFTPATVQRIAALEASLNVDMYPVVNTRR
jgi:hypothetical protein